MKEATEKISPEKEMKGKQKMDDRRHTRINGYKDKSKEKKTNKNMAVYPNRLKEDVKKQKESGSMKNAKRFLCFDLIALMQSTRYNSSRKKKD